MHDAPILKPMPLSLSTPSSAKDSGHARAWALALGLALSSTGLWSVEAQPLSSACEEFKTVLVGRMDPSIRGYAMETMPANAPTPDGGKVIGTCEGGALKIVYFRFGAPAPAATSPAPLPPTRPAAPSAAPSPTATAPVAIPPAPKTLTTPATAPATPAVAPSVAPVQATARVEPEIAAPQGPSAFGQVADFMAGKWPWLLALLTLAIAGGVRAWWVHHNAYDAAGLPRGPRL
jgi:hypothetical protein